MTARWGGLVQIEGNSARPLGASASGPITGDVVMRRYWCGLLYGVFFVAVGGAATAADPSSIDWSNIEVKTVQLFYPGASTYDWLLSKEHKKGYKKVPKGESCTKCHELDEAYMGKMVLEEGMAEPNAAPNRRAVIDFSIQAAYDQENVYLRFQWKSDSKGSADEPDGVAIMFADKKVKRFIKQGCWATCHEGMYDTRDVPSEDEAMGVLNTKKVTKYLHISRSDREASWNQLKSADALAQIRADGGFVDLWRWSSSGEVEDESVLEARLIDAGASAGDVHAKGEMKDGKYTVVMWRKLDTGHPEDDKIMAVKKYLKVGFAVHDNNVDSRYHYTSFPLSMGIGTKKADINAVNLN